MRTILLSIICGNIRNKPRLQYLGTRCLSCNGKLNQQHGIKFPIPRQSFPHYTSNEPNIYSIYSSRRLKSKSSKGRQADDDLDDEEEIKDDVDEDLKYGKVSTIHVSSLRLDMILKAGFGHARNKSEALFYANKIYINGKRAQKKNQQVELKDEVDIVRGYSALNDKFIEVMRLEILDITVPKGSDTIVVKVQRSKQLTIENYAGDSWSGTSE